MLPPKRADGVGFSPLSCDLSAAERPRYGGVPMVRDVGAVVGSFDCFDRACVVEASIPNEAIPAPNTAGSISAESERVGSSST